MKSVLLGMSGGIDSTAAAVILIEQGYTVTGLTFKIDFVNSQAVLGAQEICEKLKIKHIVIDITDIFNKNVVKPFIKSYEKGETPNPCIECNKFIKFGYIYDYATKNNFDYISTGHYAVIETCNDKAYLKNSIDTKKDQTYFLHVLKENQLKRILFPLGKLSKEEAREICSSNDLLPKQSKESQEICFIKDNYKNFLIKHNAKNKKGNFVFENKEVIKQHDGIINYTIGQRKKMNLAIGRPAYVKSINKETGDVVITTNEGLFTDVIYAKNLTLINNEIPINTQIYGKIRYSAIKYKVRIKQEDNIVIATFDEKQRAVTKGQSIVFYTDDYVIGGAIIIKGENEND